MRKLLILVLAITPIALADGGEPKAPQEKRRVAQIQLVKDADVKGGLVIEMIELPAGEFMMGASPGDEKASPTEEFRRKVRLSKTFYLSKFEVTDQQWRFVLGKNPSPETASLPAAAMTWAEANEFAAMLTKRYPSQLPRGMVFRLPTEAEWEYASRAGTTTRYSFGDDPALLKEHAWFRDNAQKPMPVGQKKPNAWGFHDMTGNVWEMCLDFFLPDATTKEEVLIDPINLKLYPPRFAVVTRGGSYVESATECRLTLHSSTHYIPKKRPNVGFRLAIGYPMPIPVIPPDQK